MQDPQAEIPVTLSGASGVTYGREPVSFGVPFSDRVMPADARLRAVDASGKALPVQTSVMATWNKDLRYAKWMLVDVQPDGSADGIRLEGPVDDPGPAPDPAVTVEREGDLLVIDTGPMRLRLRTVFDAWTPRESDSVFAGCSIRSDDGRRDVLHGDGVVLFMRDARGNEYDSLGVAPAPRVTVEEEGPLRVCVLVTGHLSSPDGVLFCPYRMRLHLYAGKSDMRVFHTFIFNQDPNRVELAAIGMRVHMRCGDEGEAAVGVEDGTVRTTTENRLSILQSDDLRYDVSLDDAPCGSGERAPGWASLCGSDGGCVAAVRYFRQEYPKGFRIERDLLEIGIRPGDAPEPLSFLTPFREPAIRFDGTRDEAEVKRLLDERPDAPLNLKSFNIKNIDDIRWVENVIERLAPDRVMTYNDSGTDNGIGAAKTTEMALRFTDGPVEDDASAAFAATVQEPLVGVVEPEYLCGTGAFGQFMPAGDPRFKTVDQYLDAWWPLFMVDPVEKCRLYGMMRHGNMICLHSPAVHRVYHYYKDRDPEKALRYVGPFNNEAFDQIMAVWCQYIRTGDRDALRIAQLASRATADTAFVHAYPGHEERIGCMHYHNGHQWSGGLVWSHSLVDGIMADYYLTGNRRMLEIALEAADGVVDKMTPAGLVNSFSRLVREFTGPLSVLLQAYQATWHERYGDPARRSIDWFLRAVRTPGWIPRSLYTRGPRGDEAVVEAEQPFRYTTTNAYQVFAPALRLFPSQALADYLLAVTDYYVWKDPKGENFKHDGKLVALGYALTRDPDIAAHAYECLRAFPEDGLVGENEDALYRLQNKMLSAPDPDDPEKSEMVVNPYIVDYESWVPRLMRVVADAMDADPDGFLEHVRKWREKRESMPDFRQEGPPAGAELESLGRLSTAPHPPLDPEMLAALSADPSFPVFDVEEE